MTTLAIRQPYVTPGIRKFTFRDKFNKIKDSLTRKPNSGPSILAIIPAHNEEQDIRRTLESLLSQTRKVDKIVVVSDNSTDDTVKIARSYKDVTVYETVNNTDKKVGALTQGWQKFAQGFDYILGLDADTSIHKDAVSLLEKEMQGNHEAAGVSCRFTLDQSAATSFLQKQLVRAQRFSFAQWTDGLFFRNRATNVLGGQASLFRVKHLEQVVAKFDQPSPWVNTTDVEDARLTNDLHSIGKKTLMSGQARAYAGSMTTVKALKTQQSKWASGHARLWWEDKSYSKNSRYFVHQQIGLALNGIARLLLVVMLTLSLSANQFDWNPLWLLPIVVTMLVNLKTAIRVPHRTAGDIIYALLVLPGELWLIAQIWISFTGWLNIWFGTKVDGWAKQYAAERGDPTQRVLGKFLAYSLLAVVVSTAGIGAWLSRTPADLQTTILTDGWLVLSGLTIFLTLGGIVRLVRPTRGLRP